MANNPLLQVAESISIKELLHEELAAFELFLKTKEEQLRPLIIRAGEKLKPYAIRQSDICAILVKTFPAEFERDIRRYCPTDWKRAYIADEDDQPPNDLYHELFVTMAEVLADGLAIMESFSNEYVKASEAERKEIIAIMLESFGSFAEMQKRLEEWKELSVQMAKIKQMHDRRTKLDALTKFLLRIQSFYLSKNRLAELSKISSKWIKQDIENKTELEDLAQKLWLTDLKYDAILDWFQENLIRNRKGMLLLPMPHIVMIVQK